MREPRTERLKIKAKKSLGQNFLKDDTVIERILTVADITSEDLVFEIGPGMGALTERLAKCAKKVVAIEIDPQLVERLKKIFAESSGVSILEGNILEVDLNEMLEQADFPPHQYKIVANLPYYITAPILRTLLALKLQPKSLTLMVQKEVAERMTAPPGEMSLLSLMVQYYTDARIALSVPATSFVPVPEVESAVVLLLPKRLYSEKEDRKLFRIARAGFSARRKTLANNLASSLHLNRQMVEKIILEIGLRKDIRAQALSVPDWECLSDVFMNI